MGQVNDYTLIKLGSEKLEKFYQNVELQLAKYQNVDNKNQKIGKAEGTDG